MEGWPSHFSHWEWCRLPAKSFMGTCRRRVMANRDTEQQILGHCSTASIQNAWKLACKKASLLDAVIPLPHSFMEGPRKTWSGKSDHSLNLKPRTRPISHQKLMNIIVALLHTVQIKALNKHSFWHVWHTFNYFVLIMLLFPWICLKWSHYKASFLVLSWLSDMFDMN